jgi:hypothetical protein
MFRDGITAADYRTPFGFLHYSHVVQSRLKTLRMRAEFQKNSGRAKVSHCLLWLFWTANEPRGLLVPKSQRMEQSRHLQRVNYFDSHQRLCPSLGFLDLDSTGMSPIGCRDRLAECHIWTMIVGPKCMIRRNTLGRAWLGQVTWTPRKEA